MRIIYLILSLCILAILINSCKTNISLNNNRQNNWAKKEELKGLYNLYKIDANLYRSEQPDKVDMTTLKQYGINTIINLRHTRTDKHEAKNVKLNLVHIPINTWTISYDEIVNSIVAINIAKKPVLIHCLHGSDRTGCIAAAYRMTNCGWTKEEAIKEFLEGGFGYHEKWFPNILELINSIDVEKLKQDIKK